MKASTVEMSGCGAPCRTATPIAVFARSVRLPATTWFDFVSASITASGAMRTSAFSPPSTLRFKPPPVSAVIATVCPVSFWNPSLSSVTMAFMAPALSTRTSAPAAAATPNTHEASSATANASTLMPGTSRSPPPSR